MEQLLLVNSLVSIDTLLRGDPKNKDNFLSNLDYASKSISMYLKQEFEQRYPPRQRRHSKCLDIINNNASDVKYLNQDELDDEICFTAINNKPRSIRYIPRDIRTSRMWEVAVDKDPNVIEFLSDNEVGQEIYDVATAKDPSLIRHVPRHFITYKMSLDASLVYAHSIENIPNNMLTEEMCGNIVRRKGYFLSKVPSRFITSTMCKDAVLDSPHAIRFVPTELATEDLYLMAVKLDGSVLELIKKEYRTDNIRLTALNNYMFAIKFLDEDEMSEEVCQMIVSKFGLCKIPRSKISPTVAFSSLNRNVKDIKYVPLTVLTPDMCKYVLNNQGSLDLIPSSFLSEAICRDAILANIDNAKYVPQQMRTREISILISSYGGFQYLTVHERCKESCIAAIQHDPFSCKYMTEQMLLYCTKEDILLAEEAVRSNGFVIGCIIDKLSPPDFDIHKLCLIAVKNRPLAIKYVSKYLTDDLIEIALSNNAYCYKFLPDEFKTLKHKEIALIAPICNNGRKDVSINSLFI